MERLIFFLLTKNSMVKVMVTSSYRLGELGNCNEIVFEVQQMKPINTL